MYPCSFVLGFVAGLVPIAGQLLGILTLIGSFNRASVEAARKAWSATAGIGIGTAIEVIAIVIYLSMQMPVQ